MDEVKFTDNAILEGLDAANDSNFGAAGGSYCYGVSIRLGFVITSKSVGDFDAAAADAKDIEQCIRTTLKENECVEKLIRAILVSKGVSRITASVSSELEAVVYEP